MFSIANHDEKRRDEIIFGTYDPSKYVGGIRHFQEMTRETLHQLIDEGFVNTTMTQNNSPSIQDFVDFIDANDNYVVAGYVIAEKRKDYGVSIDTIKRTKKITSAKDKKALAEFAQHASAFDPKGYAWWD